MTTLMEASKYYVRIINKAIEAGESLRPYADGETLGGLFPWARENAPEAMSEYARLETHADELIRTQCGFDEYKKAALAAGKALIKVFEAKAKAQKATT